MRADGRKEDAIRKVALQKGILKNAEGSCLIKVGDTHVLCAATVEDTVPPFLREAGHGWVTAEYGMLPRSTASRTPRGIERGRAAGRTYEIQRLIGRALRCVTELEALGSRTIILDCDVIQADGGTRTAAITGAFVALVEACQRMRSWGVIEKIPVKDYLAAISVGQVRGRLLLDLTYEEDSATEVDMNFVMTASGQFVEIQGTAEKAPFSPEMFTSMSGLAMKGIERLVARERQLLGDIL